MMEIKEVDNVLASTSMRAYLRNKIINKAMLNKDVIDVDDVVQDTLVRAITAVRTNNALKFENEKKVFAWAGMIVTNIYIDKLRKKTREKTSVFSSLDDLALFTPLSKLSLSSYTDALIDEDFDETVDFLLKAISKLPADQQKLLNYLMFRGYKYKDICEETGEKINTLLARMRYARLNLKKILQEDYKNRVK